MLKQFMTASVLAIALGTSPALAITSSFDVPGTWPTDGAFDDKKSSKTGAQVSQDRTSPLASPVSETKVPSLGNEAQSR